MTNVRRIWHFKSQNAQYQGMLNSSIANFFIIFSKTYNIFLYTFSDSLSLSLPLSHFILLFVSHLIPLSTTASLSHHISLSQPVPTRFFSFEKHPSKPRLKRLEQFIEEDLHLLGVSRVGFLEVGLWLSRFWWFSMEVRQGNQIGVVWWRSLGIFG